MITRGNAWQDIFHSREDHDKFIQLLIAQKHKLPFYLYAYCLMTNHSHPLAERESCAFPRTPKGKGRRRSREYS